MNMDKDMRPADVSEVNEQPRVLSIEEVLQKLNELSEAAPEERDALWGNLMTTDEAMETKKEDIEKNFEATKSDFIRRADEMTEELIELVDQKGTSRAVILVAIEDNDKGDTDNAGVIGGNERQLLRMFKAMWHDEKIGPFMGTVAFLELGKVALNDGRK